MKHAAKTLFWFLFFGLVFIVSPLLPAQSSQTATVRTYHPRPIPALNQWRKTPVNLRKQTDTVPTEVRAVRNAYWDLRLPHIKDQGGQGYFCCDTGAIIVRSKVRSAEFTTANTNYQWVIGTFESYRVYQTSDRGGLYTEMNIRINHVFEQKQPTDLNENQLIDIAVRGGMAQDQTGNVIDFLTSDLEPLIEPGHKYLMQIIPCSMVTSCSTGVYFFLARRWDLTSGIVTPIDEGDVRIAKDGLSVISGKSTEMLIQTFQEILSRLGGSDSHE
jgi:hypothetical protein